MLLSADCTSFRECLRCNILQPRDCTIISRMEPKQVTISKLSQWTRLDDVDHRLYVAALEPIRRGHVHLCRLAAQRPCPVRKRFSVDHVVGRWRLKPGSLMVGSEIRFLLVTEFDCQSSFHLGATSNWSRIRPYWFSRL